VPARRERTTVKRDDAVDAAAAMWEAVEAAVPGVDPGSHVSAALARMTASSTRRTRVCAENLAALVEHAIR